MLSVLPIVGVIVGGIYRYRIDRSSTLLDAQVLGPALAAAFGWLAPFLTFWLDPRSGEQSGKRP